MPGEWQDVDKLQSSRRLVLSQRLHSVSVQSSVKKVKVRKIGTNRDEVSTREANLVVLPLSYCLDLASLGGIHSRSSIASWHSRDWRELGRS